MNKPNTPKNKSARKNSKDPRYAHLNIAAMSAASTNDLTGLIPSAPIQDEEMDSYHDLYNFDSDILD